MNRKLLEMTVKELYRTRPWIDDYFSAHSIDASKYPDMTFGDMAESLGEAFFLDIGSDKARFIDDFFLFIEQMQALQIEASGSVFSVSVSPGRDKAGNEEPCGVTLKTGEITAIVGPTGAGKSRLLEDIECLAQNDTPTGRKVLVNNRAPDDEARFASESCLVAQLSQNMNFVMDLCVEDFLTMHAESRMVENIAHIVQKIFETANDLAGEPFDEKTPITQLSGGQSRSLMIADTALLSAAPIILIDEIENAGVDKARALDLLVSADKIVLISTHDPLLALSAHQRIVIRNGGMQKIIRTTKQERGCVINLKKLDNILADIRKKLRNGEEITQKELL